MKNLFMMFCGILLIMIITGCSEQKSITDSEGKIIVFTAIPPVSSIAEAVGGEYVAVKTLLPEGQNPHSFTPRPGLVKALGQAKLYVSIDMQFEQNIILPLLGKRDILVCQADSGVKRISIGASHHRHDHAADLCDDHCGNGNHIDQAVDPEEHAGKIIHPDPHIWLSTVNDLIIAKNITESLCRIAPLHAGEFRANLEVFSGKLSKVKKELHQLLGPFKGKTLYVYHPAFGYFADEFGLKQEAVENKGKQPTPKELAMLIKNAKHDDVKFIFVQPRFSERSAQIIANQIGGQVIRLNPLSHDLLGNYIKIAESIKQAMGKTEK